jgi:SAM-dependent methyltransferase
MRQIRSALPYLNLGCGLRYDARWTNIDFQPGSPLVIRHDLLEQLPFADHSFTVVYHSHVLEHFAPDAAVRLLRECYRVLRPGGLLRIVVPDLESAAEAYLASLKRVRASADSTTALGDHSWMVIEMIDQLTRASAGGYMRRHVQNPDAVDIDFVRRRVGNQALTWRASAARSPSFNERVRDVLGQSGGVRRIIGLASRTIQDSLLRLILPRRDWAALRVGRFRLFSGEVHQWMYDSASLTQLLADVGFEEATVRTASSSSLEDWSEFHLDVDADGSVWLPNSLYVECRRPAGSVVC